MNQQDKIFQLAENAKLLLWKLAYYVYEGDWTMVNQFSKLTTLQKDRIKSEFREVAREFYLQLSDDDEPTDSPSSNFLKQVADLYCDILFHSSCLNQGTYSAGLGIVCCCLRSEGWHYIEEENEQEFKEQIFLVDPRNESYREDAKKAILANWHLTGWIDRSGFDVVKKFRFKHRNRIDSLFQ